MPLFRLSLSPESADTTTQFPSIHPRDFHTSAVVLLYRAAMYLELVSDQHRRRFRRVLLTWLATFCTCGYLFPWAVATTRGKANADAIGIVNLALGWTVIGWFVALGRACKSHGIAGLRITD